MPTILLAVLAGIFAAGDNAAADSSIANLENAGNKVINLAMKAKGRILGSLVRQGMTEEDVCRILGRGGTVFLIFYAGPNDVSANEFYAYPKLGVCVFFRDEDKIFRVDHIDFWEFR